MIKIFRNLFKIALVLLLITASTLTVIANYSSTRIDPIAEIQKLKNQNRRDDALDLVEFLKGSDTADLDKLAALEKDLEYTIIKKVKSFTMGAIIGEVYDIYSGLGAILSDLCIYGDIRDLGIQSWRYLNNQDTDLIIVTLSGLGIILSAKPFVDVIASYSKTTVKYLRRASIFIGNNSILNKLLKGKLSLKESKMIFTLLKKTDGQYLAPHHFFPISAA